MKIIIKLYKKWVDQEAVVRKYIIADDQGNVYETFDNWETAYKVACDRAGSPENVECKDCGFLD